MTHKLWTRSPESDAEIAALFGELDQNIKWIRNQMRVDVFLKDGSLAVEGEDFDVDRAAEVIDTMATVVKKQGYISLPEVKYLVSAAQKNAEVPVEKMMKEVVVTTAMGKPIRAKTIGQKRYLDAIRENGFTFGIGPAGTGKTYLAVAMAVRAFKNREVNRIILTRPAVEAGESLGFLPGDLQDKIDPYLRPLYDALFEIMGNETYMKLKEKGQIEVAPLAYMRGRTLDNSFIILDEAQNTTNEQMKMFLTRLGYGSKAVITGDITQIDLPRGKRSGLITIRRILRDVEGVAFCVFDRADVVRHPLVQRVIEAFERFDKEEEKRRKEEHPRAEHDGQDRHDRRESRGEEKRRRK